MTQDFLGGPSVAGNLDPASLGPAGLTRSPSWVFCLGAHFFLSI